jgi:RimJ/RimL family protein N-acetyltransferase
MSEPYLGDPAEESVECNCPYCGKRASFQKMFIDRPAGCPFCGEIFMVPITSSEPATKFPLPIQSSRLQLRRVRHEDKIDCAECDALDPDMIDDWMAEDMRNVFVYAGNVPYSPGGPLPIIIETLADKRIVGWVNLQYIVRSDDDRAIRRGAEFRVSIGSSFRKQGYGVEAARAVQEFGFNGIHLRRFTASCDSENTACRKMLEKAGMRPEGVFYQNEFTGDDWRDTAYYAMLAAEFAARPAA